MSTVTLLAIAAILASLIPLAGIVVYADNQQPYRAWVCEALFVILAGGGIMWLLIVGFLAVLF